MHGYTPPIKLTFFWCFCGTCFWYWSILNNIKQPNWDLAQSEPHLMKLSISAWVVGLLPSERYQESGINVRPEFWPKIRPIHKTNLILNNKQLVSPKENATNSEMTSWKPSWHPTDASYFLDCLSSYCPPSLVSDWAFGGSIFSFGWVGNVPATPNLCFPLQELLVNKKNKKKE